MLTDQQVRRLFDMRNKHNTYIKRHCPRLGKNRKLYFLAHRRFSLFLCYALTTLLRPRLTLAVAFRVSTTSLEFLTTQS